MLLPQEAGIPRRQARSIGIAVDHRRRNRSLESLQVRCMNVQRCGRSCTLCGCLLQVSRQVVCAGCTCQADVGVACLGSQAQESLGCRDTKPRSFCSMGGDLGCVPCCCQCSSELL